MFKVLSADVRVRIVQLLKNRVLCVGALSARLGITQGAVSQHLRILREAGLAVAEKKGYYTHYRLNKKALKQWKDAAERLLKLGDWQDPASERENGEEEKPCVTRERDAKSRTS
jgi:DNA-binding transcriptional ArsR family regulator